jgi:hypothetical protein
MIDESSMVGPAGTKILVPSEPTDAGPPRRATYVARIPRLDLDRATRWAGAHWIFLSLLGLGAALRVLTMLGNRPALWFGGDSDIYVTVAADLHPPNGRPAGYGLLLWLLRPFHSFTVVALVQHLLGLAVGILIYALLNRRVPTPGSTPASQWSLPRWAAALAAAPALLDAYQIQVEHLVMSDAVFGLLIAAGVAQLVWRGTPTIWQCAASLLLLAFAALTRTVGLPIIILAVAYLIVRRVGWKALAAAVLAASLPLLGYATWFNANHGTFALTGVDGAYLWSRTATFADCRELSVPSEEQALCPDRAPLEIRRSAPAASQWLWHDWSPLRQMPGDWDSSETNALARSFALHAITGQPLEYAEAVGRDFLRTFKWNRDAHPGVSTVRYYEFPVRYKPLPTKHSAASLSTAQVAQKYAPMPGTKAVQPYASWIHDYQKFGFVRGPILGLILLIGLFGIARRWRTSGRGGLLPWLSAITLLVVPPMTADFDHRYVLPAIPLACLAAAMAARQQRASA